VIENATIISLQRVTGATGSGQLVRTTDTNVEPIRCTAADPSSAQRWNLGATIKDASIVVYVPLTDLSGNPIRVLDLFTVQIDGLDPQTLQVVHVVAIVKDGGLSHCQVFGKAVGS
jgi:hypothetical protein